MDECRLCHIVSLGLQGLILFMKVVKAQLSLLINFVRSMLLNYYPVLKKTMKNLLIWKSFTRPTYKFITLKNIIELLEACTFNLYFREVQIEG